MSAASRRAKANKQKKASGGGSSDTATFSDKGLSSQISALQTAITAGGVPTADENGLQNQMNNITGSSAMGQAAAQDPTKNPVAMGFQTGQAAAIAKQAQAANVPLAARLATLQNSRKLALDASTKNLGFLQDKFNQENSDWKSAQAQKSAQAVQQSKAQAAVDVQDKKGNIALQIAAMKKKSGRTSKKSTPKATSFKNVTKKDPLGGTISGTFNPSTGAYNWNN